MTILKTKILQVLDLDGYINRGDYVSKFEEFEDVEDSIKFNYENKTLRVLMCKVFPQKARLPDNFDPKDYDNMKAELNPEEVFYLLIREENGNFYTTAYNIWEYDRYETFPMVHDEEILFYLDDKYEVAYIHTYIEESTK
ncbi:MAG: hypothetical protein Q4F84_05915 [Fibrobacter sp.]|nr:hypothetical protein [Fibrobacter sp.]